MDIFILGVKILFWTPIFVLVRATILLTCLLVFFFFFNKNKLKEITELVFSSWTSRKNLKQSLTVKEPSHILRKKGPLWTKHYELCTFTLIFRIAIYCLPLQSIKSTFFLFSFFFATVSSDRFKESWQRKRKENWKSKHSSQLKFRQLWGLCFLWSIRLYSTLLNKEINGFTFLREEQYLRLLHYSLVHWKKKAKGENIRIF